MKRITIYMAVIAMMLLSCNSAADKEKNAGNAATGIASGQKAEADSGHAVYAPPSIQNTHEDWDKKIIKTADVTLELKDYAAYNQSIHKGLKAYGAYISTEEQSLDDIRSANNITIKVPVEQFENLMNSFSGDGIKVLQKKIGSEDVSGEVVDTRSRLEAKKQMRERYLGLLKQAKNMKEILEVQDQVNSIQQEIESAAGRVSYLNHQSAYSTIRLTYFQYLSTDGIQPKEPGYIYKLKEAFSYGIRIIANLFIFMVTLWPLFLCGAIAVIIWKKRKINIMNP